VGIRGARTHFRGAPRPFPLRAGRGTGEPSRPRAGGRRRLQGNATNEANNPLTAKITVNLQDYYTPSFYGPLNSDANSLLLRGLIPMNVGGLPQLLRFTLPYSVNPSPEGYADGLGDFTVFDLFMLTSRLGLCSSRRPRPTASPAPDAGRLARRARESRPCHEASSAAS